MVVKNKPTMKMTAKIPAASQKTYHFIKWWQFGRRMCQTEWFL